MERNSPPMSAVALLALSESVILTHVQLCPRLELARIYRLGLVCRCVPIDGYGFGLRVENCPCKACGGKQPVSRCWNEKETMNVLSFKPCGHTAANTLVPNAAAVVLARLWPRVYAEPPLDDRPSDAAAKSDRLGLVLARRRRHRRLWHPRDAQQAGVDGLADAFGVKVNRRRNGGIDELGIVQAQGQPPTPETLESMAGKGRGP